MEKESRTLRADPLTGLKGEGGSRLAPFGLTVGEPRAGDKLEIGKVKLENGEKIPTLENRGWGRRGFGVKRPPTVTSSEAIQRPPSRAYFHLSLFN